MQYLQVVEFVLWYMHQFWVGDKVMGSEQLYYLTLGVQCHSKKEQMIMYRNTNFKLFIICLGITVVSNVCYNNSEIALGLWNGNIIGINYSTKISSYPLEWNFISVEIKKDYLDKYRFLREVQPCNHILMLWFLGDLPCLDCSVLKDPTFMLYVQEVY